MHCGYLPIYLSTEDQSLPSVERGGPVPVTLGAFRYDLSSRQGVSPLFRVMKCPNIILPSPCCSWGRLAFV